MTRGPCRHRLSNRTGGARLQPGAGCWYRRFLIHKKKMARNDLQLQIAAPRKTSSILNWRLRLFQFQQFEQFLCVLVACAAMTNNQKTGWVQRELFDYWRLIGLAWSFWHVSTLPRSNNPAHNNLNLLRNPDKAPHFSRFSRSELFLRESALIHGNEMDSSRVETSKPPELFERTRELRIASWFPCLENRETWGTPFFSTPRPGPPSPVFAWAGESSQDTQAKMLALVFSCASISHSSPS